MISARQEIQKRISLSFYIFVNLIAFYIAFIIKNNLLPLEYRGVLVTNELWITIILIPFIYYFWAIKLNVYRTRYKSLINIIVSSVKVSFAVVFSLFIFFFFLKFHTISRILMFLYFGLSFFFLVFSRYLVSIIFRYYIKKGFYPKNIIIIGGGNKTNEFITSIHNNSSWGVNIIGIIENDAKLVNKTKFGYKVIGTYKDLKQILIDNPVDEVICSIPLNQLGHMQYILETCQEIGITASIISNFFNLVLAKSKIDNIEGIPVLSYSTIPTFSFPLFLKRTIDIIFSATNIALFSPVFLFLSIIIKITSPGPIFFIQERCGLNGRRFKIYKFRTMVKNAVELKPQLASMNETDGPVFKIKNDPRITWIGKILRKTSLDEIPQFINVIKGEMSIVGPRPPIPEEVEKYETWQRRRLSMRPGLTCLWQISGRSKISFENWMKLDLRYIDNWDLGLDFKIILKTIPVVLFGKGAY